VPSSTALVVLPELQQHGRVVRGWLGVAVQGVELAPTIAHRLGLPSPRALAVAGVTPGSPAERAGVQQGDLLVSIEQRPIRGVGDLFAGLPRHAIGQPQQLRLLRHNEILKTVVTPAVAPAAA
jgi:S1-C subfamily serine protease